MMKNDSNRRLINRMRQAMIAGLILLYLVLAGCAYILPETTALDKIHETYRLDFQKYVQLSVPVASTQPTLMPVGKEHPLFADTLRKIRDYRVKYGEDSQEAAHLKVLEGMIYLQSGQVGMARLVASDVQAAQSKLISKTGSYTRDQLLAGTYPDLIAGWEQIVNKGTDAGKLKAAADRIGAELRGLDKSKMAEPEVDEGAVYLATTAAIFYVWVYSKEVFSCAGAKVCADGLRKDYFGKGKDLIGMFLSETEKKAAADKSRSADVPPGRLRYISWYGYLLVE